MIWRFRPLIRGFFFYGSCGQCIDEISGGFPSPYSGILFLSYVRVEYVYMYFTSFRPLIRGFFFYKEHAKSTVKCLIRFRPLIRGFFFY